MPPWDEGSCVTAASRGCLKVLQWLRAQDPPWDGTIAQAGGQYESLQVGGGERCPR